MLKLFLKNKLRFRIPFTIADIDKLKRSSSRFTAKKKDVKLDRILQNANINLNSLEYKGIMRRSFIISLVITYIISTTALVLFKITQPFLISLGVAVLFSAFISFRQRLYPQVYDKKRIRNIEKNLIPALNDMLIQLNSGIPLFNMLANISSSDYGELSSEFKKATKKINAGFPETEVLEELGEKNDSVLFKRTLWQISNGMRAGSDISIVIKESIKSLNEEQLLQIQNYGNKLNPLIMFYLLISVILPALSITFLTILTSMVNLSSTTSTAMFIGLFVFVVLIQVMFLGMVRSIRPSLL